MGKWYKLEETQAGVGKFYMSRETQAYTGKWHKLKGNSSKCMKMT